MKHSILCRKSFIPVYFIVAFVMFLLFKFYIRTDNFSVYVLIAFIVILGFASIIYNYNRH
ncbi:hypothetical protein [Staphylococcus aureus]|uniref:hypothetical protein n=1 Tax=Staphylococcus aureus TaxID=1280 RepID=UPI000DA7ED48|nr:hypothetical protein [Staphylococcus aureus]PZL54561.1 hypothetical protein C7P78_14490 [Staphylococcus aureus]